MTLVGGFGGESSPRSERRARDGESSRLFTPETLLPTQLPCVGDTFAVPAGVRGLMLAILEDAIYCLRDVESANAKARKEARQAEGWIRERGETWVFSFDSICTTLDLDTEELRFRLLSAPPEEVVAQIGRRRRSHRVERGKRKRRATSVAAVRERKAAAGRLTERNDESDDDVLIVIAG